MKIYMIGQKGIPSKYGGVEKHVEELSARLVKQGHEVFVYARPNYTDEKLKEYKGVNIINLPSIATKHLDAITHTFMACLDLFKRDVDVIHFHSIGPSSLIPLAKIIKPGVPVISTFHTEDYFHKKWGMLARTYLRLGEIISCLLADKTIVVSRSLKKKADKKYKIHTHYIPNGVSLPKYAAVKFIKPWGLTRGNYIVSVSRLIRHKGIHHLIEAYNQIKTGKKLVIVGGGSFTDDYVRELKLLASGNKDIIFTGSQSGRTLEELFSNAYLFVQPSESEGLSIALLEAMAYKKSVLTSNIPENLEVIEDTGFTFENKNVEDLAEKLRYLLRHPATVKAREGFGHERVKKHYNWENITKEITVLYEQVATEKYSRRMSVVGWARKVVGFFL